LLLCGSDEVVTVPLSGLLELVLVAGLGTVFGVAVLDTPPIALTSLAGVCALLAGSVSAVSVGGVTVRWRYLVGVSYVAFALVWPAIYVPDVLAGTVSGQFVFVVAMVGALSLVVYGFDIVDDVDTTLQNVHYHLNRLHEAGVIDVVDTAYSEKGREMNVYQCRDRRS
jgi:hypothetical protein